jgi:hypothetical protein
MKKVPGKVPNKGEALEQHPANSVILTSELHGVVPRS